jgi:cyclophilin family peptidyl-prolyl cis-trans isomerase
MKRIIVSLLFVLSVVYGQVDEVVYDSASQRLSYIIDYNRLAENAVARECSVEAFENGLLHSVVRHLLLDMPYEASFYAGVTTLDVRVLQDQSVVLYASMPLVEAKAINTRFRVFMNSFASPRAGYCFTVETGVLESWVSTLLARNGELAYDNAILQIPITKAKAVTELTIPGLASTSTVASEPTQATPPTVPAEPEPSQATVTQTAPQATAPQTPAPQTPTIAQPTGFNVLPYISGERTLTFASAQQVLKANTDYAAIIETSQGTMTVDLFEQQAPLTVNNFVFLSLNQYYDGVSFYRVLEDFMAQTGDPTGTGLGSPGYQFADEIEAGFSHAAKGVVSMANAGPNTNDAQFFITLEATPWLDGKFSIFGAVIEGLDVLDKLQRSDPATPLAIAPLDSSLGLLQTQGIIIEGNDRETLSAYLTRQLKTVPSENQRFALGIYDVVLSRNPDNNNLAAVFYTKTDTIEHVYIIERPR